ncbi:MAG TPA: hypothetical protein DCE48_15700 [Lachnospiraceae bacterium]|uniref:hypothetical protein n=1 Tax=Anaerosporobacter sp. TaxID=1872529 RepID=UPI000ED86AB0|nr:hypothetical protein [Anaerosporobacter sp.]HAB62110.1 hypothetical protein [Lachnospiraceae bacterium]
MMGGTGNNNSRFSMLIKCPKCNAECHEEDSQTYECPKCGHQEPTDYGKVRTFLDENGNATAMEIARATGVPIGKIHSFLRNGRLEIPEDSDTYIECKRCGTDIRYGKYCPECANILKKELRDAFDLGTVGAVPKHNTGKMQFLNRDTRNQYTYDNISSFYKL